MVCTHDPSPTGLGNLPVLRLRVCTYECVRLCSSVRLRVCVHISIRLRVGVCERTQSVCVQVSVCVWVYPVCECVREGE